MFHVTFASIFMILIVILILRVKRSGSKKVTLH